jgi:hypothetical protein
VKVDNFQTARDIQISVENVDLNLEIEQSKADFE